jgi:hypothetical protein
MIRSEEPFSAVKMEVSDEGQSGSVVVCTFPGLIITDVNEDGDLVDMVLCKANVELESVLLDTC